MLLRQIIQDIDVQLVHGRTDTDIHSVESDSRAIRPGSLFVAVDGYNVDGHSFIAAAIKAGATAVLYDDEDALCAQLAKFSPANDVQAKSGIIPEIERTTFARVASTRDALPWVARNFYGDPSSKIRVVGITGTNGKTTTATLLYNMFRDLGYECGLLSTIANYVGPERSETANTTSDPLTINRLLARMVDKGCEFCFMEVSSIGLEQKRVAGLRFEVAVFSNLTHDHLDYHHTYAEYIRCKKILFDGLDKNAFAIVNMDDKVGPVMVQNTAAKVVTYSCKTLSDHNCRILEESFDGMQLRIDGRECWTQLIGEHNAYNLLAVYTTATVLGTAPEEALVSLSKLRSAPGRLETLRGPEGKCAVIDYAHTPDALQNVLKTLRDISCGKEIVCLFGCGGDRDRTKRPEMAAVAEKYADKIVVTSDNSRSEKTEDILAEIRTGFSPKGLRKALFISDRREAIRTAILTASRGAAILLAGKGHEHYQILGRQKFPFDEPAIVRTVFAEMEPDSQAETNND